MIPWPRPLEPSLGPPDHVARISPFLKRAAVNDVISSERTWPTIHKATLRSESDSIDWFDLQSICTLRITSQSGKFQALRSLGKFAFSPPELVYRRNPWLPSVDVQLACFWPFILTTRSYTSKFSTTRSFFARVLWSEMWRFIPLPCQISLLKFLGWSREQFAWYLFFTPKPIPYNNTRYRAFPYRFKNEVADIRCVARCPSFGNWRQIPTWWSWWWTRRAPRPRPAQHSPANKGSAPARYSPANQGSSASPVLHGLRSFHNFWLGAPEPSLPLFPEMVLG